ncbi:hypothetical protein ABZ342_29465 [Amycolatopsis sp. NPDC005961]|uniref:hypothetical protein n=1 Tax=Amycolatopsis sp. NPDC005961 TaxID=3156720 RepID=UPI0033D4F132
MPSSSARRDFRLDAQERRRHESQPGARLRRIMLGTGVDDVDAREAVERRGQPSGDDGGVAGPAEQVDPEVDLLWSRETRRCG